MPEKLLPDGSARVPVEVISSALEVEGGIFGDTMSIGTIQLSTDGLTGPTIRFGSPDPVGNVTGNPGDLYIEANGVSSNLHIYNAASAGNTDWKVIPFTP